MVQALSTNTFTVAKWVVAPIASQGTHTTVASALASASSGDTIWIRDGTYTENITLKNGVNMISFASGEETQNNATIAGLMTVPAGCTCSFQGLNFTSNGSNTIVTSGTNTSNVTFIDCKLSTLTTTGINNASTNGTFRFENCTIDNASVAGAMWVNAGTIRFDDCDLTSSGGSTAVSTSTSGLILLYCVSTIPMSQSGSALSVIEFCSFNTSLINTTVLALTGTSTANMFKCHITSGTASAVSIGSGCTATLTEDNFVSSNTNAITGAGTLRYTALYYESSSGNNVTTQTPLATQMGTLRANSLSSTISPLTVVTQVFTSTGTYTPTTNMRYCIVECVGGGGAGGGAAATGATTQSPGGGGGGGGYSRKTFSAADIGASKAVTIGAAGTGASGTTGGSGGTSSLGSLITASGGVGGQTGGANTTSVASGGTGGTGTLGDFNTTGTPGANGWSQVNFSISGAGGSSYFGGGGGGFGLIAGASGGTAATSHGGGGGGAAANQSQSAQTGGAGFKGIIVVTEYVFA